MNKIPVGKTIAFAYRFAFGSIGTVIGLIWLPLIVSFVGQFFAVTYVSQLLDQIVTDTNPLALGRLVLLYMSFVFVGALIASFIAAPLTRQALGLKSAARVGTGELYVFLSFLAVFGVFFVMFLIWIILANIMLAFVAANATRAAGSPGQALVALGAGVGVLVLLAAMIYIAARLTFLVVPVAVAENKVDLIRAWTLTRANFWRILLVGCAILIPIGIVYFVSEAVILGPQGFPTKATPTDPTAPWRQLAEQFHVILPHLPVLTGLGLLLAPFSYGLTFAGPAFAYQSLVGTTPPTPPDMGPLRPA